uniref:Uncharacterized protein n=1 Tax=Timema tahoe TaxID=61484 RepID=A0A7R9ILP0_9NEOP|nr:unnamed protein product [Timema tahoe]
MDSERRLFQDEFCTTDRNYSTDPKFHLARTLGQQLGRRDDVERENKMACCGKCVSRLLHRLKTHNGTDHIIVYFAHPPPPLKDVREK